jgi:hypothetical protein
MDTDCQYFAGMPVFRPKTELIDVQAAWEKFPVELCQGITDS